MFNFGVLLGKVSDLCVSSLILLIFKETQTQTRHGHRHRHRHRQDMDMRHCTCISTENIAWMQYSAVFEVGDLMTFRITAFYPKEYYLL